MDATHERLTDPSGRQGGIESMLRPVAGRVIRPGLIDARREPAAPVRTFARPKTVGKAGSPQSKPGDCFVVVNGRGQCWGGVAWVDGWCNALQFRRPTPAYEMCERAAREAERMTGVAGVVCYIPPGTPPTSLAPFPDLSQVDLRDFARNPDVC